MGYADPPKEHQFSSENQPEKRGRPVGSKSMSTILREMLDEEIEVNIDGEKTKKKFADIIVRKLVKKAHDGDLRAIQEIFDRTEGKSRQEVNGDFQHKLEITWNEPAGINLSDTTNKGSNGELPSV